MRELIRDLCRLRKSPFLEDQRQFSRVVGLYSYEIQRAVMKFVHDNERE